MLGLLLKAQDRSPPHCAALLAAETGQGEHSRFCTVFLLFEVLFCPPRSQEQCGWNVAPHPWDAGALPSLCSQTLICSWSSLPARGTGAGQGSTTPSLSPGLQDPWGFSPSSQCQLPEASGCGGGRGKAKVRDSAPRIPLLILHQFCLPFYGSEGRLLTVHATCSFQVFKSDYDKQT